MRLTSAVLITSLVPGLALSQTYTISTYAGGAPPPTPIAAVNASIGSPAGVAVDAAGNVYFTSLNCVFKLDPSGLLTRVAGNSRAGFSGDGGPAIKAQLNLLASPNGLALDALGNLYILDAGNLRVRKISRDGIIATVAGNGVEGNGIGQDGLPATSVQFYEPRGVAVDGAGNLYIADFNRVRKVSSNGIITTVAGNGDHGSSGCGGMATDSALSLEGGIAIDSPGNIYIAIQQLQFSGVCKVSPAGTITFLISRQPGYITGVGLDINANVYFTNSSSDTVTKVSPGGIVTSVASVGSPGFSGAARDSPVGVAADSGGNLYVADTGDNRVRKISATGIVTTVAGNGTLGFSGDGSLAARAQLSAPYAMAIDSIGSVFIADSGNNRIRKVSTDGIITTAVGIGTKGYSGDGGQATSAQLIAPAGIAIDAKDNLYIADSLNFCIRKVTPAGIITTVAGPGNYFAGDGGLAISAQLNLPSGVALDNAGNLYLAETYGFRIRKVSPAGIITTIAGTGHGGFSGDGGLAINAQLNSPDSVAVDRGGNVYIADTGNSRIRKVSPDGIITTVVVSSKPVGPTGPVGLALDASGNLFFVDQGFSSVRKLDPSGIVTTIAGGTGTPIAESASCCYSGDGGPATSAQFNSPRGLAIDHHGNLYVADHDNNAVRLLQPRRLRSHH